MTTKPLPESLASAVRRMLYRETVVLCEHSTVNRYDFLYPDVSRVAYQHEAGIPLIIRLRSYGALLRPSYMITSNLCRIRDDVYQRSVTLDMRLSVGVYRCSRYLRGGGYPVSRAYAEGQGKHGIQAWYTQDYTD